MGNEASREYERLSHDRDMLNLLHSIHFSYWKIKSLYDLLSMFDHELPLNQFHRVRRVVAKHLTKSPYCIDLKSYLSKFEGFSSELLTSWGRK